MILTYGFKNIKNQVPYLAFTRVSLIFFKPKFFIYMKSGAFLSANIVLSRKESIAELSLICGIRWLLSFFPFCYDIEINKSIYNYTIETPSKQKLENIVVVFEIKRACSQKDFKIRSCIIGKCSADELKSMNDS